MRQYRRRAHFLCVAIAAALVMPLARDMQTEAAQASGGAEGEDALQFCASEELELKVLLDLLVRRDGLNIYHAPNILRERIHVAAGTVIPSSSLRAFVEQALAVNGYALVKEPGGWLRVVKGEEARRSPAAVSTSPLPTGEGALTWVQTLEILPVQRAAEIAKSFLSAQFGYAYPVAETNTLILVDCATNLRRVASVLQLLDRPNSDYETVRLAFENSSAEAARAALETLLSAARSFSGVSKTQPTMVADKRTNSLIAIVRPTEKPFLEECVRLLDTADISESARELVSVSNLSAAQAVAIVTQLEKPEGQSGEGTFKAMPLQDGKSIILQGSRRRVEAAKAILLEIDVPRSLPPSSRRVVYPLSVADAAETASLLGSVLSRVERPSGVTASEKDEVSVTALPRQNAVLIDAPSELQAQAEKLIEQLDRAQPQVLIQSLFFTTTAFNETALALEAGKKTDDYALQTSFGLREFNDLGKAVALSLPFGLTGAVFSRDQITAVLTLVKSDSKSKVLSGPVLLVVNNEEAKLKSVTESPYTEVSSLTANTATTTLGGYAEAGMDVTLKPTIGEGDIIRLAVSISSSQFAGTSAAPEIPPARVTNSVDTSINLKDGDAVIIGGLSDSKTTRERTGVPILKDIPVLGALFGRQADQQSRSRFYVLMQPRIIRSTLIAGIEGTGLWGEQDGQRPEPNVEDGLWYAPGESEDRKAYEWHGLDELNRQ